MVMTETVKRRVRKRYVGDLHLPSRTRTLRKAPGRRTVQCYRNRLSTALEMALIRSEEVRTQYVTICAQSGLTAGKYV